MSRYWIFLIAVLFLSTASQATCIRPEKPKIPDAKTVTSDQAQKLDVDMQRYSTATNNYVACLSKEASDAQGEATKMITYYNNEFLAVYNKRTQ